MTQFHISNYIQKVKGQLHCDIIVFCKQSFLASVQRHTSGTGGDILTIPYIWSDTELVTLFLDAHLEAVMIIKPLCADGVKSSHYIHYMAHGWKLCLSC